MTPSTITGARGTGALHDMLRPDYGAKKRKRRPKKRRVPPRPMQYRRGY